MKYLSVRALQRVILGALCLGLSASALAYNFGKISCKVANCGMVSNVPKTTLISVNPDPLPVVDAGGAQSVTVRWSVRFGLKATYEICVTDSLASGAKASDRCLPLPGATVVYKGIAGNTYDDQLTLDASFYRPQAQFYLRTTAGIYLAGTTPPTSNSGFLDFVWPLTKPNLYAHNPDGYVSSAGVEIEHPISNYGSVDADASVTEFTVRVCDGLAMLPLENPEDPESEQVCLADNEHFLGEFVVQQPVSPIAAGNRVTTYTNITSLLPSSNNGLWLTMSARVDIHNDVDESEEGDNVRAHTAYLIP